MHGPELSWVRVHCGDVLVDVTVGSDEEAVISDDGAAAALARALYPALGC